MNNIYIVNKKFNCLISLNFKTDTYIKDENTYKFEIINKNKILLDSDEYYTNNSYLYFSNIELENNVKMVYLINSSWIDQILIFKDTYDIKRIKHTEQKGNIIENNEHSIKINWFSWDPEIYNKIDDYTYIVNNYKYSLIKIFKKIEVPIHIFIHICTIENWKDIFIELIECIKKSGLYDITVKIHLGILGNFNVINDPIFNDNKFNILYIDTRYSLYENHTINFIKYFCSNIDHEIYVLYIHTKGVRKAGNINVTKSWREMMEYFLINKYIECLNYLELYDTLGNNIIDLRCVNENVFIDKNHSLHYSGNFWWSKKSYIDKLSFIDLDLSSNSINSRYIAENWILSNYPNCNIGIIYQDNTNTHPYHRYVFDYYKKMSFIVKKFNKC